MLGRYVSDLQVGEKLGPVDYVVTPFLIREYAHGVEETAEVYHRSGTPEAPQLMAPTFAHLTKVRVFNHSCPQGAGPSPRIHVEYDAAYHRPIAAGTTVRATGEVLERYVKRGREWLVCVFAARDAGTGELLAEYRDVSVIGTVAEEEPDQ